MASPAVPVNADIPEIDVTALDIPDMKLDPLGARGIGEIGITEPAPPWQMRSITLPVNEYEICP
jgi:CO/xanthine dehydrogenase Mo-binding subunit